MVFVHLRKQTDEHPDLICVEMKLLVFAHTPPPHHGQSYMVQLMLDGFGGDNRGAASKNQPGSKFGIECYHVNARLSQGIHEIGGFQPRKLFALCGYCLEAIWCRFRHGVTNFYYVPAPGHRSALYRDWLVMLVCRPFFKNLVFHWHAAGLAEWLITSMPVWVRGLTQRLLGKPQGSIVLSGYNNADAEWLCSRLVQVVHNGIEDCCPEFEHKIWPTRLARSRARQQLRLGRALSAAETQQAGVDAHIFKVLYVAQCSREKGLFDAIDAVALSNAQLTKSASALRVQLTVAGEFVNSAERAEFDARIQAADLKFNVERKDPSGQQASSGLVAVTQSAVQYVGFLGGEQKRNAFIATDCFCLPTYYANENQPVSLLEAMAFGLPIVTTRWRSLPELFPEGYFGLVKVKSPKQIAEAFLTIIAREAGESLRPLFLSKFTLAHHLSALAAALQRYS